MQFIRNGLEEKKFRPLNTRNKLRNFSLDFLSKNIQKKFERYFSEKRNMVTVLCLHNIFEDEEARLTELINYLSSFYKFISYSDAVDKIQNNDIDDAYLTITADDGYKNNLKGGKIMKDLGVKCCFFLCPQIIGISDYNTIKDYNKTKFNNPPIEFLNWKEVNTLLSYGHEIGNHTFSHPNIANCNQSETVEEIFRGKEILTSHCGEVNHFAWPYGKFHHFSSLAHKTVFETGHISCASAERGSHVNGNVLSKKEDFCIRREPIHLSWSFNHMIYFLYKSLKNISSDNNYAPSTFRQ